MRARAHALISAQVSRYRRGAGPEAAAALPAGLRLARWAQQIAPANASQPVPAELLHGGKPGRAKARIGDDDGAHLIATIAFRQRRKRACAPGLAACLPEYTCSSSVRLRPCRAKLARIICALRSAFRSLQSTRMTGWVQLASIWAAMAA